MQQNQPTPPNPAAPPDPAAAPSTYTPRCTPALIDSARADAIEALQALLKETAPLDILDDLPERSRGHTPGNNNDDHDSNDPAQTAPGAPSARHTHASTSRGRALRFSLRLRAATALLRIRLHTTPAPPGSAGPRESREAREVGNRSTRSERSHSSLDDGPLTPEDRTRAPRSPSASTPSTHSAPSTPSPSPSPNPQSAIPNPQSRATSSSPTSQSEFRIPQSASPADDGETDASEPTPRTRRRPTARELAEEKKAQAARTLAHIQASGLAAYENYLKVTGKPDYRLAARAAAHDHAPPTGSTPTHRDDPPT